MRIRMTEFFQGTGFPTLPEGKEYSVPGEVSENLSDWLLSNGKAVLIDEPEEAPIPEEPAVEEPEPEEEIENVMVSRVFDEPEEEPEIEATSAARKLAEEEGVDLADVVGTGSGGRVVLTDVQVYLEEEKE